MWSQFRRWSRNGTWTRALTVRVVVRNAANKDVRRTIRPGPAISLYGVVVIAKSRLPGSPFGNAFPS